MSLSDEEESETFLSEQKEEEGNDNSSKLNISLKTGEDSKLSRKSCIRRKFGFKKKEKKNPEEKLNKVNDNFWPIGNRSYTLEEKLAIGGGTLACKIIHGIYLCILNFGLCYLLFFVKNYYKFSMQLV